MTDQEKSEFLRAVKLLPGILRDKAAELPEEVIRNAEEIRLRTGQAASVIYSGKQAYICKEHELNQSELQICLEIATKASAQSYQNSISQGFVTAKGGCRLGLCGTAVLDTNGNIISMRRFSSICIRIPREKKGCGDDIFNVLASPFFESTLIISPPGGGKTTLLRELIRLLSNSGINISVCDERNELSGIWEGTPCFDLGSHTDVLSSAPKYDGVMMLLKTMSPQILAFDEITSKKDIDASIYAANCGVKLLSTAHASNLEELESRDIYKELLDKQIFKRAVIIENHQGERDYICKDIF